MNKTKANIKQPVDVPPALTRADIAAILGVDSQIVARYVRQLKIRPLRMCGITCVYAPEMVDTLRRVLSERSNIYRALVQVGAQPAAA
jgi:hypothetical protein